MWRFPQKVGWRRERPWPFSHGVAFVLTSFFPNTPWSTALNWSLLHWSLLQVASLQRHVQTRSIYLCVARGTADIGVWRRYPFSYQSLWIFARWPSWQDFGTQVYHSRAYQQACKENCVEPGRFVTPQLGEFMAGLYLSFILGESLKDKVSVVVRVRPAKELDLSSSRLGALRFAQDDAVVFHESGFRNLSVSIKLQPLSCCCARAIPNIVLCPSSQGFVGWISAWARATLKSLKVCFGACFQFFGTIRFAETMAFAGTLSSTTACDCQIISVPANFKFQFLSLRWSGTPSAGRW